MAEKTGSEGGMRVDTELVKKLAKLLDETNLNEIEVEDAGRRIKLVRHMDFSQFAQGQARPGPTTGPAADPAQPVVPPLAPAAELSAADHPGAVKSPMVGTVFLAAEPGATPFVAAGARVQEGDTLLIIEAMKVMNPITAPKAGIVKEILVQDAQPVEYEQPLAIIE